MNTGMWALEFRIYLCFSIHEDPYVCWDLSITRFLPSFTNHCECWTRLLFTSISWKFNFRCLLNFEVTLNWTLFYVSESLGGFLTLLPPWVPGRGCMLARSSSNSRFVYFALHQGWCVTWFLTSPIKLNLK